MSSVDGREQNTELERPVKKLVKFSIQHKVVRNDPILDVC